MRRARQEITDPAALADILARGRTLHLGMCDGDEPYVVPVDYGFDGAAIYVHCATEGRKLDIVAANPRVCFEVTVDAVVEPGTSVCNWSTRFASVIGWGTAELLTSTASKAAGLTAIVRHYSGGDESVPAEKTGGVAVLRIRVERMTGKRSEG